MARALQPMAEADWAALRAEMVDAFTPGAPIDEVSLFAGRQVHIQRLRDAVASKGRHAVIYGERGTGKTSLVNIFHLGQFHPRLVSFVYVQCSQDDTFNSLWRKALRRILFRSEDGGEIIAHDMLMGDVTADELEVILANFALKDVPIIVFDEFDRIRDENCKALMSETIKQLSNSPQVHATIIIVGVADDVNQLIQHHASIARALIQVRMPRMNREELQQIVTSRLHPTPLSITGDSLWRIAYLSSGLPFYCHSLGQAAALLSIERKNLVINEEIVRLAIDNCFDDVDQLLIDSYLKAVIETRKGNLFKYVLAACALSEQNEMGRFSAVDVVEPLSAIYGETMEPPAFTFHLNELCTPARGGILAREGGRGKYRYRFVQPIIQPFIIMKSLSAGVLTEDVLSRFAIQRQQALSI